MVINCTSISGYEGEELDARSDEERDEERLARPPFGEGDVCLSDAETLGSNGSDELTDYENSGAIEHQRNGEWD